MRVFRSSIQDQCQETNKRMEKILTEMNKCPNHLIVQHLPGREYSDNRYMFNNILNNLEGKHLLDLGCGDGMYSIYLLRQGARRVHAVDISRSAVSACRKLADLNGVVSCLSVCVMDAKHLAYRDNSFDVVFGHAVLHHFDDEQIYNVIKEVYRVLKVGGEAVFLEPIEDSSIFERIQQLVPAGRDGTDYYRPSCLSRKKFGEYKKNEIDAALTTGILMRLGCNFDNVQIEKFGLLIRLDRFTFGHSWGQKARLILDRIDQLLFGLLPYLRRYCRTAVVQYSKLK